MQVFSVQFQNNLRFQILLFTAKYTYQKDNRDAIYRNKQDNMNIPS